MAYDQTLSTVVLFGGSAGTAYYNDIWSFDFTLPLGPTWPRTSPPSARDSAAGLLEATQELILFGGFGTGDVSQDIWAFGMEEVSTTEETLPEMEDPIVIEGTTTVSLPQWPYIASAPRRYSGSDQRRLFGGGHFCGQ